MARKPRIEGAGSKKRSKMGASGRRSAPKRPQKRARKTAAKPAKAAKSNRPADSTTLKRELSGARARQAATAEVLKIIASSPSDVKPVFKAIVGTIVRMLRCDRAFIMRCEGKSYYPVANASADGTFGFVDITRAEPINPALNFPSRAIVSKKTVYYPDRSLIELPEYERMISERYGVNASLFLPLLRQDECIGVVALASKGVNAFSKSDIAFAESFRDQALIAIENARLFNETREALAQQTATSEVLQVISSSTGDLQPVFDRMLEKATRVCGAQFGAMGLFDGEVYRRVAIYNIPPAFNTAAPREFRPGPEGPIGMVQRTGQVVRVDDLRQHPNFVARHPAMVAMVEAAGARTLVVVPMLRDRRTIGAISIYQKEVRPFTDSQINLLENFASQAVIAIENARLFNETREALAQQTATSEVLQVISSSTGDLQPVFKSMLNNALRICEAKFGQLLLFDGRGFLAAELHNTPAEYAEIFKRGPLVPGPDTGLGRLIASKKFIHIPDVMSGSLYTEREPLRLATVEILKARTLLAVPMLKDTKLVGAIVIYRQEARPFSDRQIKLVTNFAAQAVIAIENARLFNETKEALERQTATADILKVIASSPDNVQPVFDAIAQSARRVIGGHSALVTRVVGEQIHLAAFTAGSEAGREKLMATYPQPLSSQVMSAQVARAGRAIFYTDTERDADDITTQFARLRGYRSIISVPMLRDDVAIGTINVTRTEPGAFDENTIGLLRTFAHQAVIAIENARLFNETKEALARQTATADVLKVIASSPSNLQPVFDAIAARSNELVGGHSTTVGRYVDGIVHLASFTPVSPEADAMLRAMFPSRPTTGDPQIAQVLRGEIARIAEAQTEIQDAAMRETARARGWRSRLIVPLKDDNAVIGWISVTRREPGEFADKDVELLRTFADQAVIAIQNVELFEEVQARTRDLQESLQQQTATADVLKVISRSAFELQTVLDTLVASAAQLCEAEEGIILQPKGDGYGLTADWGVPASKREFLQGVTFRAADGRLTGAVLKRGSIVHVRDVLAEPEFIIGGDPDPARTRLGVPLLRGSTPVGVFVLTRREVRPFTERQIELVQSFADQAVIAIENTRLFNETREALARQTATAEVLKVIASSPSNLQPVFDAIAARSKELVAGHSTTVFRFVGDVVELVGATSVSAEADAVLRATFPMPISRMRNIEQVLRGEVSEIADVMADTQPDDSSKQVARARGWRSRLVVPLKGDNAVIGFISITRKQPGTFPEKDKELIRTFADQAVIAIQNVELFEEVQARTRELSQSLDDLRAAQDRLVQTEKLASLGQLTAGIAHEIKNPLNFVNNFSALSVELTDELNDVLRQAELTEKIQQEVNDLTQILKSNLEKVVQHGKRADSIVKNMLLHSREGSGEQRAADINTLVEESLNLAYHGARAEKSGFNITVQRKFDAGAGSAELFPQEMTRALLNLISNGFYAASKRKAESRDGGFEPTLLATTRDLGHAVEIRIRDNGTGIPPEVKEKMFNPFFTTKPAGEGTGLGLSMTHDIIVKQHGGTIDVATEPGNFTEFIVVLPRANGVHGKSRGPA